MVPVLASLLAEATGIGGVLIIIAGFLAASGVSLQRTLRPTNCIYPLISSLFNSLRGSHNTVTTAGLYAPPVPNAAGTRHEVSLNVSDSEAGPDAEYLCLRIRADGESHRVSANTTRAGCSEKKST